MKGFWDQPDSFRDGAFFTLRHQRPVPFFSEPELPGFPVGPGFWSVTTFDDVWRVSRNPKTFSSVPSIVLADQAPEVAEFFGSMIDMDEPRHAAPEDRPRLHAARDRVSGGDGAGDGAPHRQGWWRSEGRATSSSEIAAPLPLQIVCDMMGIPGRTSERCSR